MNNSNDNNNENNNNDNNGDGGIKDTCGNYELCEPNLVPITLEIVPDITLCVKKPNLILKNYKCKCCEDTPPPPPSP